MGFVRDNEVKICGRKELLEFITKEGLQELKECLFGIPGKVERSQKKSEILQKIH